MAGLVLIAPGGAHALSITFTRVVDTTDLMPEGLGADQPFRQFFYVSLDAGVVTFSGDNSLNRSGIYRWDPLQPGPLQPVATQAPLAQVHAGGYTGGSLGVGPAFATDGAETAMGIGFIGAPFTGGLVRGTPGNWTLVAKTNDPMPGYANNFGSFDGVSLSGGEVVWRSQSQAGSHENGVYSDLGGVHAVALRGDPTPGLNGGTFKTVANIVIDGADRVFEANSTAPGVLSHNGYYMDSGAGPQIVVDSNTARPGGAELLHAGGRVALHRGAIAFGGYWDKPTMPIPQRTEGIYSTAGGLHTVADTSMTVPGGGGAKFDLFANHDGAEGGGIAVRDGIVAFLAYTALPNRMEGIYLETCGGVEKLIAEGDPLDGGTVMGLNMKAGSFKPNPLGGYSLAFLAVFTDFRGGVYRADFALPAGGPCGGSFAVANNASGVPLAGRLLPATVSGVVRVERVNTTTGAALTNMTFFSAGGMSGRQVMALPNIGGTAAGEVAVLATRNSDGQIRAEIRDADSRALLKSFTVLSGAYLPVWLFEVPDLDGNGKVDVGLLAMRKSDGRALVKLAGSLSGTAIGSIIYYTAGLVPLMAEALPDLDGSGQPEVAVLAEKPATDRYQVQIRNALGAAMVRNVTFAAGSDPLQLIIGPDKDNNALPELSVLARQRSDGRALVEMRNAFGAAAVKRVFYTPNYAPVAFAQAGDTDANSVPEWALLLDRNSDHRPYTQIRNQSGAAGTVTRAYLTTAYSARQMVVLPDSDGIGGPDIGVIARRNSDGRLRMEIRNARGGGTTRAFFFSP